MSGFLLLSCAPALTAVPVPTGTLDGVFELLGHAAYLAYPFAGWAIWLVDHPVVHAIRYYFFNCLFGHVWYPLSEPSLLSVSDGNVGNVHLSSIEESGPEQYVVLELLNNLSRPTWYAPHGKDGNEQVVGNPQQVVDRA